MKNFKVFVTGGELKLTTDAYTGGFAIEFLNKNELNEHKRNINIKDFLNRIGIIYEKYLNNEEQSKIYYDKVEKVLLLMKK